MKCSKIFHYIHGFYLNGHSIFHSGITRARTRVEHIWIKARNMRHVFNINSWLVSEIISSVFKSCEKYHVLSIAAEKSLHCIYRTQCTRLFSSCNLQVVCTSHLNFWIKMFCRCSGPLKWFFTSKVYTRQKYTNGLPKTTLKMDMYHVKNHDPS